MKRSFYRLLALVLLAATCSGAYAQFNLGRALGALVKTSQALTISDEQMAAYVKQSVQAMDAKNDVVPENDPYAQRLRRLTAGMTQADGIPLNFKVYKTNDINAFACPDGSVRVFTGIMDMMNDDELLGIIGHEIGHVQRRHSRKAFKNQLLGDALKDAVASAGQTGELLSQSALATLGQGLANAQYSQKQENEADDSGYEFLVANGRNPWGMVQAFQKMQSMEQRGGQQSSYMQKMFSSHPETAKRIERMSKRAAKEGWPKPGTAEDEGLQPKKLLPQGTSHNQATINNKPPKEYIEVRF